MESSTSTSAYDILFTLTTRTSTSGVTTTTTVHTNELELPNVLRTLVAKPTDLPCTVKARSHVPHTVVIGKPPATVASTAPVTLPTVVVSTPPATNPWRKLAAPKPPAAVTATVASTAPVGRKPRVPASTHERSDRPTTGTRGAPRDGPERDPAFYAALDKFRALALSEVMVGKEYVDEQLANEPYLIRNGAPSEAWCVTLNALRRQKVDGGKRIPREERMQLDDEEKIDGHEFSRSKTYSSERFQRALWEAYHALYPTRVIDVFTTRGGKTMLKIQV